MATPGRNLQRLRAHHPERILVIAAALGYLALHQEVLTQLNLLIGP